MPISEYLILFWFAMLINEYKPEVRGVDQTALSQSEELSSDLCCFHGGSISHDDIMHSSQKFIVVSHSFPTTLLLYRQRYRNYLWERWFQFRIISKETTFEQYFFPLVPLCN